MDEEKVKEYFDKIVAFINKTEKEYNNSEIILNEKIDIYLKDFEELKKSSMVTYLNNSYDKIEKDLDEYTKLIEGIKKFYNNLPKDANLTELFIKQKAIVLDEYKKLKENSKDIINGSYVVQKIKNLKNNEKLKDINNMVKTACKNLLKKIKHNLEVIANNLNGIQNLIKNKGDTKLKEAMEKIKEKLSNFSSDNMPKVKEFFEKLDLKLLNNENLKKVIDDLKALNERFNATQETENIKSFFIKTKELQQNLLKISKNQKFKELIKNMLLNSEGMSLTDFIRELRKSGINYEDDIKVILQVQFLIDDIKEILSSSAIAKEIEKLFPKKDSNLRVLSPLSKKKKRGLDSVKQIICKMDQTFTEEDDILKPKTQNLNKYFLSDEEKDVAISQTLQISVKKDAFNCNTDHLTKLKSIYVFKSYSDFQVEKAKSRIKFKLHTRKVASFTKPSFFYILVKFRFKYTSHNLRRLDDNEDVDSYCLLNNETNSEDNVFQCYGYPDKLNETENIEGIEDVKSDYITVPSNSTEPDDTYYNTGINNFKTKKGSGLSGGAIAGIVIACVAVLAIIIGIIAYARTKAAASPVDVGSSFATNANIKVN